MNRWHRDFEQALELEGSALGNLTAAVRNLIGAGADREHVRQELESYRLVLQAEDREDDEDVVLEVLDFVTGWCRPDLRIE